MQFFLVQRSSEVKRAFVCRNMSLFYIWVVPSYVWGPFWSVLSNPVPSSAWKPSLTLLSPSTYFQPPLFLTEAQDMWVGSRVLPPLNQCSSASMWGVLGKNCSHRLLIYIFCVSTCKPSQDLDYIKRDLLPFSQWQGPELAYLGHGALSWACQWDLSSDWLCQWY